MEISRMLLSLSILIGSMLVVIIVNSGISDSDKICKYMRGRGYTLTWGKDFNILKGPVYKKGDIEVSINELYNMSYRQVKRKFK